MRRIASIVLAALLCLVMALPAQAETQYPLSQGIVTDLADALGEDTVKDLKTLSQRMNNASLGAIYVVTRHFLGGTDASAYAKALFDAWQLNSDDVLLLMVIGEEKAALAVGSAAQAALPRDTQTSLLATHFNDAFKQRNYDGAAAEISVQLCAALAKIAGVTVNTAGLFGASAAPAPASASATAKPQSLSSVWESMFSMEDYKDEDEWPLDVQYSSRSSFNWRGWLIWGLVIYFLFFRKKRKYNFNHKPGRR